MTQRFVERGDKVFVVGRDHRDIVEYVQESPNVFGHAADVGNPKEVAEVFSKINEAYEGELDILINCAAQSGGYNSFNRLKPETMDSIIRTNLVGTSLCTKHAFDMMSNQDTGGAIFNLLGNGSNGFASPNYAVYGSTKAAVQQLTKSLQKEWIDTDVDLHLLSPGLMSTNLLLENLDKNVFKILQGFCSSPEVVAMHLVPRIRSAYYCADGKPVIKFQTPLKIATQLVLNAFKRK